MLISIITINYNNRDGLKKTMASVFEQTHNFIDYIIIDGDSNDGSRVFIEQHKNELAYSVSEPDEGIYHAMNKGIAKAKGDYILFLNSGDWLVDTHVIENFVKTKPIEDIVYGDAMLIHQTKDPVRKKMPDNLEGLVVLTQTVTHQSIFHKRNLFNNATYDLKYTMLADWVFYNTVVLINKGSYRHIDLLVVNYDTTGFSSNASNRSIMKKERVMFYMQYASHFTPLLIQQNELILQKYKNLQKPSIVKWAIKIAKKLKLIDLN